MAASSAPNPKDVKLAAMRRGRLDDPEDEADPKDVAKFGTVLGLAAGGVRCLLQINSQIIICIKFCFLIPCITSICVKMCFVFHILNLFRIRYISRGARRRCSFRATRPTMTAPIAASITTANRPKEFSTDTSGSVSNSLAAGWC